MLVRAKFMCSHLKDTLSPLRMRDSWKQATIKHTHRNHSTPFSKLKMLTALPKTLTHEGFHLHLQLFLSLVGLVEERVESISWNISHRKPGNFPDTCDWEKSLRKIKQSPTNQTLFLRCSRWFPVYLLYL